MSYWEGALEGWLATILTTDYDLEMIDDHDLIIKYEYINSIIEHLVDSPRMGFMRRNCNYHVWYNFYMDNVLITVSVCPDNEVLVEAAAGSLCERLSIIDPQFDHKLLDLLHIEH